MLLLTTCLFTPQPFVWEGNWTALFAACYLLIFGVIALRYATYLSARTLMPATAATGSRLAGFSALVCCVLMIKLAFFSIC